ncbi:hypothetical protein IWW48_005065 [Coemansia sp. RSA 1200]|nr:hypothetical protein IWW48_005065 [Coemansia sp. RSA 1200]
MRVLEKSVSVLALSGNPDTSKEARGPGSLIVNGHIISGNDNDLAVAGIRHPISSSGNETGSSRSRALTSIKERAVGLRRKKDKRNSDSGTSTVAATDNTQGGSINSRNENQSLGSSENAGSIHGSHNTGSFDTKGKDNNTDAQSQSTQKPERLMIDVLTEDISSAAKYNIESTMFTELKDLFWSISARVQRTGSLSPQRFIAKLKESNELFRSNAHQDAHEFLNYLLNEIVDNVDKIQREKGIDRCTGAPLKDSSKPRGKTWVQTLFEGLLTNETRCLSCENITSRDETMLDVSVDIHENTSVTNCLNQFAAGELMCHNNKFHCDNCGGLQEAELRMRLKRLPNILALHLKRFKYNNSLGRYVKLSYRINFPTELRVPNTAEETEDVLYSLSAIVVHLGGGMFHGHYISIVRSGDKWVLFDDDCVEVISENELSNYFGDFPNFGSGYVLFYERADFDPAEFDLPGPIHHQQKQQQQQQANSNDSVVVASGTTSNETVPSNESPTTASVSNFANSAGLVAVTDVLTAANGAGPKTFQFAEPRRPPPLVAATRSTHGTSVEAPQLSPTLLMAPGPATPTRPSPSATTTLQAGNSSIPFFERPIGANADTVTGSGMMPPTAAAGPEMSGMARDRDDTGSKATLTDRGSSGTLSKSKSWFSRRSKK